MPSTPTRSSSASRCGSPCNVVKVQFFSSILLGAVLVLNGCATAPPSASAPMGRQDLVSGRPKASLNFYQEVFGWSVRRKGPDGYWEFATADGRSASGLVSFPDAGDSAIWLTSLDVESLDGALAKVDAQGGSLLHGPVTVRGKVRTAVIQAPDGARLQLREAAGGDSPGVWIWHELVTADVAAAAGWYVRVFGFSAEAAADRVLLLRGGIPVAGLSSNPFEDEPAQWIPVLGVENLDTGLAAIPTHGGRVLQVSEDPERPVALVADPQHAPLFLQEIGEAGP